jgi:hypothetical protein
MMERAPDEHILGSARPERNLEPREKSAVPALRSDARRRAPTTQRRFALTGDDFLLAQGDVVRPLSWMTVQIGRALPIAAGSIAGGPCPGTEE